VDRAPTAPTVPPRRISTPCATTKLRRDSAPLPPSTRPGAATAGTGARADPARHDPRSTGAPARPNPAAASLRMTRACSISSSEGARWNACGVRIAHAGQQSSVGDRICAITSGVDRPSATPRAAATTDRRSRGDHPTGDLNDCGS
jgi:hypothetical protein